MEPQKREGRERTEESARLPALSLCRGKRPPDPDFDREFLSPYFLFLLLHLRGFSS
jgi:hypothetical protein